MFWPCPACSFRNFSHIEHCAQCGGNRPMVQAEPRLGPRFVKQNAKPPEKKPDPDPTEPGHYSYF
jgi:hypothetical protein